jgi:hypothetical protein
MYTMSSSRCDARMVPRCVRQSHASQQTAPMLNVATM